METNIEYTEEQLEKLTWRWRTESITKGVNEINFSDTQPNNFIIVNRRDSPIYVSFNEIPTTENYDLKINSGNTARWSMAIGIKRIYIYSNWTITLDTNDVKIYSSEGEYKHNICNYDDGKTFKYLFNTEIIGETTMYTYNFSSLDKNKYYVSKLINNSSACIVDFYYNSTLCGEITLGAMGTSEGTFLLNSILCDKIIVTNSNNDTDIFMYGEVERF